MHQPVGDDAGARSRHVADVLRLQWDGVIPASGDGERETIVHQRVEVQDFYPGTNVLASGRCLSRGG